MQKNSKNIILFLSILLMFIFSFVDKSNAQDKLFYNGYVQFAGNKFSDGGTHYTTYIYNGLRYQTKDYSLSFTIPIIFADNNSLTQIGNMVFTDNNSKDGTALQNNTMGHGVNNMSSMQIGIGDLYVYGSYNLLSPNYNPLQISLDGYIKVPTAVSSFNYGTGQFDYSLSLSLKKNYQSILLYTQIGYLVLGDTKTIEYKDPLTVSLGIGTNFNSLIHALYLEYDSYSTVLNGFSSPKQISLGYSYIVNPSLSYSIITSYGLNSSVSDFLISGGINIGLL